MACQDGYRNERNRLWRAASCVSNCSKMGCIDPGDGETGQLEKLFGSHWRHPLTSLLQDAEMSARRRPPLAGPCGARSQSTQAGTWMSAARLQLSERWKGTAIPARTGRKYLDSTLPPHPLSIWNPRSMRKRGEIGVQTRQASTSRNQHDRRAARPRLWIRARVVKSLSRGTRVARPPPYGIPR